jgi:hypothetical protein
MLQGELATFRKHKSIDTTDRGTQKDGPTIAAQMMGSVGVRQAAMARHEINVRSGNKARVIPNEY